MLGETVFVFVKSQALKTRGVGLFACIFNSFFLLQLFKLQGVVCLGAFFKREFCYKIIRH